MTLGGKRDATKKMDTDKAGTEACESAVSALANTESGAASTTDAAMTEGESSLSALAMMDTDEAGTEACESAVGALANTESGAASTTDTAMTEGESSLSALANPATKSTALAASGVPTISAALPKAVRSKKASHGISKKDISKVLGGEHNFSEEKHCNTCRRKPCRLLRRMSRESIARVRKEARHSTLDKKRYRHIKKAPKVSKSKSARNKDYYAKVKTRKKADRAKKFQEEWQERLRLLRMKLGMPGPASKTCPGGGGGGGGGGDGGPATSQDAAAPRSVVGTSAPYSVGMAEIYRDSQVDMGNNNPAPTGPPFPAYLEMDENGEYADFFGDDENIIAESWYDDMTVLPSLPRGWHLPTDGGNCYIYRLECQVTSCVVYGKRALHACIKQREASAKIGQLFGDAKQNTRHHPDMCYKMCEQLAADPGLFRVLHLADVLAHMVYIACVSGWWPKVLAVVSRAQRSGIRIFEYVDESIANRVREHFSRSPFPDMPQGARGPPEWVAAARACFLSYEGQQQAVVLRDRLQAIRKVWMTVGLFLGDLGPPPFPTACWHPPYLANGPSCRVLFSHILARLGVPTSKAQCAPRRRRITSLHPPGFYSEDHYVGVVRKEYTGEDSDGESSSTGWEDVEGDEDNEIVDPAARDASEEHQDKHGEQDNIYSRPAYTWNADWSPRNGGDDGGGGGGSVERSDCTVAPAAITAVGAQKSDCCSEVAGRIARDEALANTWRLEALTWRLDRVERPVEASIQVGCTACSRTFATRGRLHHHYEYCIQVGSPVSCKVCSCSFVTKRGILAHYRNWHGFTPVAKAVAVLVGVGCPCCEGVSYGTERGLHEHYTAYHGWSDAETVRAMSRGRVCQPTIDEELESGDIDTSTRKSDTASAGPPLWGPLWGAVPGLFLPHSPRSFVMPCPDCKFLNHAANKFCEVCTWPRGQGMTGVRDSYAIRATHYNRYNSDNGHRREVKCPCCPFLNHPGSIWCEVCKKIIPLTERQPWLNEFLRKVEIASGKDGGCELSKRETAAAVAPANTTRDTPTIVETAAIMSRDSGEDGGCERSKRKTAAAVAPVNTTGDALTNIGRGRIEKAPRYTYDYSSPHANASDY